MTIAINDTIIHLVQSHLQRKQEIEEEIAVLNELYSNLLLDGEPNTADYVLDEISVLMLELTSIRHLKN